MQKLTLTFVLTLTMILNVFSQKATIELTFTAENNGQYIPLDSILIENFTQGVDTTLYAPDTVLVLDYITSINNKETMEENTFSVSQNYPNPFKGKTEVNLNLHEKENITITVRDILGRELAHYKNSLVRGNHTFSFYPGNGKYYLLTVSEKQTSKTIKMLNADFNTAFQGKSELVYNGFKDYEIIYKSERAINGFGFSIGDELRYTAYTDIEETEIVDSPTVNQTYTFQFEGWTPCPELSAITDIDGNVYNTVLIGEQCWMKENLRTTTYHDGTSIPNVTVDSIWTSLTTGAYVWYNNDISWKDLYGALYNGYTVNAVSLLCPIGWHVPSDDEWTALTDFIGGTGSPHGNKLKSCRQVNSPLGGACNTTLHPRWEMEDTINGTDDYWFSAVPSGHRGSSGSFYNIGYSSTMWSSTEVGSLYPWARRLRYDNDYVYVHFFGKAIGYSVRCLQD